MSLGVGRTGQSHGLYLPSPPPSLSSPSLSSPSPLPSPPPLLPLPSPLPFPYHPSPSSLPSSLLPLPSEGAYSDSKGVRKIREQVVEFIAKRDGCDPCSIDIDNVFLLNGASDGIRVRRLGMGTACVGNRVAVRSYCVGGYWWRSHPC